MRSSPVLQTLARLYEKSTAGTTGVATRDFGIRFHELLELAGSTKGEMYVLAVSDLQDAKSKGAIEIDQHRRSHTWERIRVPLACEGELFTLVCRKPPSLQREEWSRLFQTARSWQVPAQYQSSWVEFCDRRAKQMRAGEGWKPFRRYKRDLASVQLRLVPKLLSWREPALIRTVSVRLTHSSKFIERCASTIEELLVEGSGGTVKSLGDLCIEHNPTNVRFNGPVSIKRHGQVVDFTSLSGESSLSQSDLVDATHIDTSAPRCVTVENATKFHELCRLRTGDLFVFTSYPTAATVEFLSRLPDDLPLFHFGDTDPWGFDVLRVLRQRIRRAIAPLHMKFRPKAGTVPLDSRDQRKLRHLLVEPLLVDVQTELQRMFTSNTKGDFEQESVRITSSIFPYVAEQ